MKYLKTLIVFGIAYFIQAQNSLSVIVEDPYSHERITNSNILVESEEGTLQLFKSNENGRIFINNLSGNIKISSTHKDFHPIKTHFIMDEDLEVKILMSPINFPELDLKNDFLLETEVRDNFTGNKINRAEIHIQDKIISTDKNGLIQLPMNFFDDLQLKENDSIAFEIRAEGYEPYMGYYHYFPYKLNKDIHLKPLNSSITENSIPIQDKNEIEKIKNKLTQTFEKSGQCQNLPETIRLGINCSCTSSCRNVLVMSLEVYTQKGLNDEWYPSWHIESLKAGGIAYRTYGAYHIYHPVNRNWDIVNNTCRQAWDSDDTSRTIEQVIATTGIYLGDNNGNLVYSEYSAENNARGLACGNGYSGGGSYPCISDPLCAGNARRGHGRGMCQNGSQRWANQRGKSFQWILEHYYGPVNISMCERAPDQVPDIVIRQMWTEPSEPAVGEEVDLFVKIKNGGGVAATPINITYKINDVTVGTTSAASLDSGNELIQHIPNYVFTQEDVNRYCVFVSPANRETNTLNNSYCTDITVLPERHPDLVILSMTTTPSEPEIGENVTLNVRIKNGGDQAASPVNVDLRMNGTSIHQQSETSLAPQQSLTISYPNYQFEREGLYRFCAYMDAAENEIRTINNSYCINIDVLNKEDVWVSNAAVSPSSFFINENIELRASQHYSGNRVRDSIDDIRLSYYLSVDCALDGDDIMLDSDISPLGVDNDIAEEWTSILIPDSVESGNYYILFYSDADDAIEEVNEQNNLSCLPVNITNNLGVSDVEAPEISIYPNPTEGIIYLKTEKDIHSIQVFDLSGKLVQFKVDENLETVDISNLINGSYILKVVYEEQDVETIKVIKK